MRHRLLAACRPTASDVALARRAADGDDDAFEKLYVRYQPRLEAYCRSIVRHDEDARDAVQNAMTKALVALRRDTGSAGTGCDPTNVQGWLFRIAHNEAISLLRRRRPTTELADVMHDVRPGPASDVLLREELRATLSSVRALPANLQHPLLLRELAGLSYLQVAEVVGGTPAAARKAVFDARTALSADRAGRDEACSVIRQSLSEGDGRRRRARVVRSHLQSCQSCCAWESEQRQRRHHLAALLPVGSAGWLAGLFGGGSTVAAGVSGSLATNAKIAASLAVIAAGAAPVVQHVEHANPTTKVGASSARSAAKAEATSSPSVAKAGATSSPSVAKARATSSSTAARSARPRAVAVANAARAAAEASIAASPSAAARRAAAREASKGDSAPTRRAEEDATDRRGAVADAGGEAARRPDRDGSRRTGVASDAETDRAGVADASARTPSRDGSRLAGTDTTLSALPRPSQRDGSGDRRPGPQPTARGEGDAFTDPGTADAT